MVLGAQSNHPLALQIYNCIHRKKTFRKQMVDYFLEYYCLAKVSNIAPFRVHRRFRNH